MVKALDFTLAKQSTTDCQNVNHEIHYAPPVCHSRFTFLCMTQLNISFKTKKDISYVFSTFHSTNVAHQLNSDVNHKVNISQPHSEFTLPFHPLGGGGRREGGRSWTERSCGGMSLSSWTSSLSSLSFRSPWLPRALRLFSLLESQSSTQRPGILLSTAPSLRRLSSSTCLCR